MKTIDLFCASPASTAICSSMDQRSVLRPGTRPMDHRHHQHRHHHRIDDVRQKPKTPIIPCSSSQLPIDPRPFIYQRNRKSCSSSTKSETMRRKSSADVNDLSLSSPTHDSSRYLLSDSSYTDFVSDSDHVSALVPSHPRRLTSSNDPLLLKSSSTHSRLMSSSNDLPLSKSYSTRSRSRTGDLVLSSSSSSPFSSALDSSNVTASMASNQLVRPRNKVTSNDSLVPKSSYTRSRDQVVELRVSIHCKGCEGKVRKHISRMEGVASFSIDLASKKVTVIGDVTPLGVLTSISRVKSAQFWPSPTSSSSSSSSPILARS